MTKEQRLITKDDLLPLDLYAKNRRQIRKDLVEFKKERRIALGPYATFYFECFETMIAQVQEMLHIEKGGKEQIADELSAYNPLIPKGKELVATLMFEIDNPKIRLNFLGKIGGVEKNIFIKIDNDMIYGKPEIDVDRTSDDGKDSSVQFIHFNFNDDQISKFKAKKSIEIGIDHIEYSYTTKLSEQNIKALSLDFS